MANMTIEIAPWQSSTYWLKVAVSMAMLAGFFVGGTAQAVTTTSQSSSPISDQAGTPVNQPAQNSPVIQTQKSTLIVGSEQDFPPFATGMTDATAGGFTVELWKAVAAEAGLNYSIRVRPFHELLQEFKAGNIDVLINLAASEPRRQFADFTVPHVVVHGAIFVRKGERGIVSESDFAGKSIIVLSADLAHDYALSKGWEKQLVLVNNAEEGLRLLASGQHDAMLLSKLAGMQTIQATGLDNIEALKAKAGFSQKFSFAVQKGQADLLGKINEGLALTKSSETYNSIYEKWFGVYEVKEAGLLDFLKYLIPIVLVFISVLIYSFYRRKAERIKAKRVLQRSEAQISTLVNAIPDLIWLKDADGIYLSCNPVFEKFFGAKEIDIVGKTDYDFVDKTLADSFRENDRRAMLANKPRANDEWLTFADGSYSGLFETIKTPLLDKDGSLVGVLGISRDITERKQAEENLRIAATAFEAQEGMLVTDAHNTILRVNQAFTKITGYSAEDAIGQTPNLLSSGKQDQAFYAAMWASINNTGGWEGEIWNRRKSGEVYPEHLTIAAVKNTQGMVTNYVATLTDITMSKAASDEIKNLAFYDTLTQLPNRRLLLDRLNQAFAASARSGRRGALLFLDLDHFKTLNDTLGHDVGDLLLQQVATRLTASVREGDTVARLGGDEFVVLLEDLSEQAIEAAAQTKDVAEKIIIMLNQPYQLNAHHYHSTPSIGATLFNGHELVTDELLKQADIAMYQSKTEGRNTLRFFDPMMQEAITARVDLEHELRKAIEQNQFQLHYQIQVVSSGQVLGAEVLIRWLHPERGLISPLNFIPLAEETGLILPIGQWVLDTACAQLKTWQQNPLARNLVLAVNVSAKQFLQEDFVVQVLATIERHGINPARLKLELTESMLVDNINDIITKMDALSKIGIRFSLDDFGTGYSSLQYLKKLPLNQLKIDQSFVRDIAADSSDRAIVCTIITMASSLDINVIAEGVETAEQQQFLLDNGCMHYQGYLFSKPVPIDEFEKLLK